jgi:hypothetical protein
MNLTALTQRLPVLPEAPTTAIGPRPIPSEAACAASVETSHGTMMPPAMAIVTNPDFVVDPKRSRRLRPIPIPIPILTLLVLVVASLAAPIVLVVLVGSSGREKGLDDDNDDDDGRDKEETKSGDCCSRSKVDRNNPLAAAATKRRIPGDRLRRRFGGFVLFPYVLGSSIVSNSVFYYIFVVVEDL